MKKYKRLWVFGDSFCTPGVCVDPQDSFWGLCARHLSCHEILNRSWSGNSVTGVMHTLISCQHQYDWEQDFFIVGIPPLERLTVFDGHLDSITMGSNISTESWTATPSEIMCRHGLRDIRFGQDVNTVLFEDRAWTEVQAMMYVYLLDNWLQSKTRNYVIVNLSKPFDVHNVWSCSEFLLPTLKGLDKAILFHDTYQSVNIDVHRPVDFDLYGWNGHHGAPGNGYFFKKSFLPKLHECGLC
jgi:hypothetical protein